MATLASLREASLNQRNWQGVNKVCGSPSACSAANILVCKILTRFAIVNRQGLAKASPANRWSLQPARNSP